MSKAYRMERGLRFPLPFRFQPVTVGTQGLEVASRVVLPVSVDVINVKLAYVFRDESASNAHGLQGVPVRSEPSYSPGISISLPFPLRYPASPPHPELGSLPLQWGSGATESACSGFVQFVNVGKHVKSRTVRHAITVLETGRAPQ